MAVLEISELPGMASMIDWALALGSSVGTFDAGRTVVREVRAGRDRGAMEGRRRAAPGVTVSQAAPGSAPAPMAEESHRGARINLPTADLAKRDAIVMRAEMHFGLVLRSFQAPG